MNVGWLISDPGYVGGAELTAREFREAAPKDVEVIDCPPGEVVPGLDRYAIHNCVPYSPADIRAMGDAPRTKFAHDMWPEGDAEVREMLIHGGTLVYCSPLHREHFERRWQPTAKAEVIPPALDLHRFKPSRQARRNGNRQGTCCIAGWRNHGKGGYALAEWAAENGPVDVYGEGLCVPHGKGLNLKGPVHPNLVPQTLWRYERFVFLPFELEPFCRSVAEAWGAGLEVVTNGLVGALEWLREQPERLRTAGEDFWRVVLADG